jgi:hypothetical protein
MAFGLSAATIASIASAAAGVAGVGTTIAKAAQGSPKMPGAGAGVGAATPDYAAMGKAAMPGAKSDAAARGLGGAAPDFLANFIGQQTGEPQAGLSVLEDLKKSGGF